MRSGGTGYVYTSRRNDAKRKLYTHGQASYAITSWTWAKTHAMHKNRTWTASLSKSRRQSLPNTLVNCFVLTEGNTAESVLFVKDGKTFYTVHNHASRKRWLRTSPREVSSERCGDHHSTHRQGSLTMTHSLHETNPSFGRVKTFQGLLQRLCRRDAARLMATDIPAHACALGALCRTTGSDLQ